MLRLDKKGVSNVIGYVLLISITIALSVIVYGWLRFYVSDDESITCSKDVSIVIKSYECSNKVLKVVLENKGLFTADGYFLRVHNRTGARNGFYLLDDVGSKIITGQDYTSIDYPTQDYGVITFIEVQPYLVENGRKISCSNIASQSTTCS